MKRSAQVALVLMGVTGATAAGAYMMPARSAECRTPAQAQNQPAPAAAPGQPVRREAPCPRRRSWGSWHWGSGSYSYDRDRTRRTRTVTPSTAFRSGPVSLPRSPMSSTGTPSRVGSAPRGGFGSTGHSFGHFSGS
jgi:hypothetical protein